MPGWRIMMAAGFSVMTAPPTGSSRAASDRATIRSWRRWLEQAPALPARRGGRALLISYEFPPTGGSGVQRPAKLVKYLRGCGWSCEVITAGHERFLWRDEELLGDLPTDCRIHRVSGWEPACLARRAVAPLRALETRQLLRAGASAWVEERFYWRLLTATTVLGRGNGEEFWVGPAVAAALRLHRRQPFDVMISTGPPHWVHRVALRVARAANIPWVADLRDPLLNDINAQPDPQRRNALLRLERAILRHATRVVTTCPSFTRELRERFPQRAADTILTITNGFDREDILRAIPADFSGPSSRECVFVHAGACYGRIQIAGLAGPLQRVLERHPEWRGRVRLLVAGTLDRRQRQRWTRDCPPWIELTGYLDHPSAIRAAAGAACSVILLPDCQHARRCIPGKTFELLALPAHILALVPRESDTAGILNAAGAATVVPFEDEPGIVAALERIITDHFAGRLTHERDWARLDRFDRGVLAADYAHCLAEASVPSPVHPFRVESGGQDARPPKVLPAARGPIRRIMFVTDAASFGGAERYVLDMAAAARRRGIDPCLCWLPCREPDPGLRERLGESGIPLVTSCQNSACGPLRFIGEFRDLLRRVRPEGLVINASGRPRWWLSCWLARLAGVPAVWVQHMVEGRDHRRVRPAWLGGRMEGPQWWRIPQALRHRLASLSATAVVALSPADRDRIIRWQRINRERITIIPPGIDCARFTFDAQARRRLRESWGLDGAEGYTSHAPFVIGTAARLVPRKGVETLIEATALLRSRNIPAVAIIAGQGPERDAFVRLAQARGVSDAVRFVGFIDDMPAFYSALDVFALCSETDSFPLSIAEAMCCGRPVVATPTTGARAQIRHLENGWQLDGFEAGELADALATLYADPALRERLGHTGRLGVCHQLSIDLTLARTLQTLRSFR
ncbi:MAG TPA: glycosyltransferase [Phycisphaerae bacterium]|nr:glycosyltransferase [Phycisphaerae bacterium]HOL24688.1 glycosyltransferase [Phycisphaerae bacterium]HPP19224.1 glycosyltransferase [Phycisphaerae bacterium]HPU31389.1 glycosyltransferase [Phycisphaerae bacterium]HXK84435.1 glycosyltransferase [Phycisphaerae bacterium]